MKRLDQGFVDEHIERGMQDAYLGVRAPNEGKARLLTSATTASGSTWGRKLRPDWLSASVARQLREQRRSMDRVKYAHILSGSNLRFAY